MLASSYEFEFTNGSQPIQTETAYVIPSSASSYVSQPASQLTSSSGSQTGHSSAYSALSASLATLKSRLSARNLSNQLSDSSSSQSSPYATSGVLSDSHSQQQQSQMQNTQSQPNYLSLSSQQDPQSSSVYANAQSQNHDNKTIVLAIPAKINFLTNPKQQHQQQQSQQQPQLTLIQPQSDTQSRSEYSTKQLLGSQDSSNEQEAQLVAREQNGEQEQHQFVIVNPGAGSAEQSQATIGGSQSSGSIYQTIYQPAVAQAHLQPVGVKYIPTTILQQKPYNSVDQSSSFEEHQSRSSPCVDTCNSSDPRWRKYTISKYKACCSRSPDFDSQLEQPSNEKVSQSSKNAEDAYYSYLYRRSRARRSKRPYRSPSRYYRASIAGQDEDGSSADSGSSDSSRPSSARQSHSESPFMKYYKSRQPVYEASDAARDEPESSSSSKYTPKERSHRRARARNFDNPEVQSAIEPSEDDNSYVGSAAGYGSGEYSVESGRYPQAANSQHDDDEEANDSETGKGVAYSESNPEYSADASADAAKDESEGESPSSGHKFSSIIRRRKQSKGKSRKSSANKEASKHKKSRKSKNKADYSSSQTNGSEYDASQTSDQSHPDSSTSQVGFDEQTNQKETVASGDSQQLSLDQFKPSYNDSAAIHLSKTTMHLKEILSILEKKAQIKLANESLALQPTTSTPAPTTTSLYSFASLANQFPAANSASSSSAEYLGSELTFKSPLRFDSSSLSSSLSSPSLSSAGYSSLASDNLYSSLAGSSYGSNPPYSLAASKHLAHPHHMQQVRRRRVNKNRYPPMMMPSKMSYGAPSSLLHSAASKSAYLNPPYYASLQYPYWYGRSNSPSVLSSYPYKNFGKSSYQSLLGPTSGSKLGSDEHRFSLASYDPLANVASSFRPTSVRMRPKPFMFQPQILPIYSRHSILSQPQEVK